MPIGDLAMGANLLKDQYFSDIQDQPPLNSSYECSQQRRLAPTFMERPAKWLQELDIACGMRYKSAIKSSG